MSGDSDGHPGANSGTGGAAQSEAGGDEDPGAQAGGQPTAGQNGQPASGQDDDDGGLPLTRRQALGGGLLAAAGLGYGGYWFFTQGDDTAQGPRVPFGVWQQLREGLRQSPDNLPAKAARLVDEGDPDALYEFARDDIVLQPSAIDGNDGFDQYVDGGPRATLRGGMATPREAADLLANLLDRAGYQSRVVRYNRSLSKERTRSLYFGGPSHSFGPDLDEETLGDLADAMGESEGGPDDISIADEGGEASAALGQRILDALPDSADATAPGFDHGRSGGVPVVQYRGDESEEWTATNLFHADESVGSVSEPSQLGEPVDRNTQRVVVRLQAARMDDPDTRMELVAGQWNSPELAGRQLSIDTLPGKPMLDYPTTSFDNVTTYVPTLAISDPGTNRTRRKELSAIGDPFTLTGETYTIDDRGTLRRDGEEMVEGDEEWDLVLELPDGTTEKVQAIEGQQSVQKYYGLDGSTSSLADGLERKSESVTFLYRDTENGKLSLMTTHGAPDDGGGRAAMTFDGVQGMKWLVEDGGNNDNFDTSSGAPLRDSETARWNWLDRFNDGGAIGPVTFPFDIEMTHIPTWAGGDRERDVERWVFVDGTDLENPIEIASFDGDSGSVTARIYGEQVEEGSTQDAPTQQSVDDVDDFSVSVDPSGFPQVGLVLSATDAAGDSITGLPASALTVEEGGDVMGAEVVPAEADDVTAVSYRTPDRDGAGERTVSVDINGAGTDETTYTVPADPTDPRAQRGLCGLYLRLTIGDRTVERTLAGWDPEFDGDRSPNMDDYDEVFSALWGQHTLSFETAGVGHGVLLDDELSGKLTLQAADDAWRSEDVDKIREVAGQGHGQLSQLPQQFQPRLPNRVTEKSLTYGFGLRTVLTGARPVFGEGVEKRWVDVLSTDSVRTLRADDDRASEFEQTAKRTARRSVMEGENFETSTTSLLAGSSLAPAGTVTDSMEGSTADALAAATDRRLIANSDHLLTAQSGETAAFWHVDEQTGSVTGVLPDGRGGGSGEQLIETLKEVEEMISFTETVTTVANAGPPDAEGAVAEFYGNYLAKLFAIATVSLATISVEEYNNAVVGAASKRICHIAGTITDSRFFQKHNTSEIAGFMNNLRGAKDHTSSTCLQNDHT